MAQNIDKEMLIKALEGRKKPGRTKRKIKREEAEKIARLDDKKFKIRTGYTKKGILRYEDEKAKRKGGYMAIRDFGGSPEIAKKYSHKGEKRVKEGYKALRDLGGSPEMAKKYFHLGKRKIKKDFETLPTFLKKSKEKRSEYPEKNVRVKREKKWSEWSKGGGKDFDKSKLGSKKNKSVGESFDESMLDSVKYVNGMVGRPEHDSYGFSVMKHWYVSGGKIIDIMKSLYPEENALDIYTDIRKLKQSDRKIWSNEIENIFNNDYNLVNKAASLLDIPNTKLYHKNFLKNL